jgi:hypothetical protein
MRKSLSAVIITALCLGVFFSCNTESEKNSVATADTQAQAVPCDEEITVLTPLGHPPNIKLKKMAPRLDTLDGKTIYIVDDGFVGGDNLLFEMVDWFKANYPKTNVLYKRKGGGGFEAEDPVLWAEMKEKADAIIIGLGH